MPTYQEGYELGIKNNIARSVIVAAIYDCVQNGWLPELSYFHGMLAGHEKRVEVREDRREE